MLIRQTLTKQKKKFIQKQTYFLLIFWVVMDLGWITHTKHTHRRKKQFSEDKYFRFDDDDDDNQLIRC